MGFPGGWEWLVVLVIVALIFGTKKLRNIGSDIGGAVKNFRSAMKEAESAAEDVADDESPAELEDRSSTTPGEEHQETRTEHTESR